MTYDGPQYKWPDFPKLLTLQTPMDMIQKGIYGGTLLNRHSKVSPLQNVLPKDFWKTPDINRLVSKQEYDFSVNCYTFEPEALLGGWTPLNTTLPYDFSKRWAWWYLGFYNGKRTGYDAQQIEKQIDILSRYSAFMIKTAEQQGANVYSPTFMPQVKQLLLEYGWLPEVLYPSLETETPS